jgi:hypothetical protein
MCFVERSDPSPYEFSGAAESATLVEIGNVSIAPAVADVVFELTADRVKRVANRDMGVLMRVVCTGVVPDNNLRTGNTQVDTNLEQVPMMVSRVPAFDDDVARGDPVGKLAKFLRPLTDLRV